MGKSLEVIIDYEHMNVLLSMFSTVWLENSGSLHGSIWREDHLGLDCGKPGRLCWVRISFWAKWGAMNEL